MSPSPTVPADPGPFPLPDGKVALLVIDMQRDFLEPGGFTHMPKGSLHLFENLLEEPSKILLIFAPSGIEGYFEGLGTPYTQGDTPPGRVMDRELLARVAPQYGIVPSFPDEDGSPR